MRQPRLPPGPARSSTRKLAMEKAVGQLGVYLPTTGRAVKPGRKGHRKHTTVARRGRAGRRLDVLSGRIFRRSSRPRFMARPLRPSDPRSASAPRRPSLTPANRHGADVPRLDRGRRRYSFNHLCCAAGRLWPHRRGRARAGCRERRAETSGSESFHFCGQYRSGRPTSLPEGNTAP